MVHTAGDPEIAIAVAAAKVLILAVGSAVTYLAYSAYRRTGDPSLRLLSVGFALVLTGVVLAGCAFELPGVTLAVGILIESLFVLAGLSVIAYSLRVR